MNESPFLIKPYIKDMTNSELFAVMVAGFGTIAGSVLGSYLSFGVSKNKICSDFISYRTDTSICI